MFSNNVLVNRAVLCGVCLSGTVLVVGMLLAFGPLMTVAAAFCALCLVYLFKKPKRLVYAQIIYCCVYKLLISDFGLPTILNYVTDLLTVVSLICAFSKVYREGRAVNWGLTGKAIGLFSCIALFSAITGGQGIVLSVWAVRNIFRMFAFFYSCAVLLDSADLRKLARIFTVIYVANICLGAYQGLVLHLGTDNISGFFGTETGGNAGMALLIIVASTFAVFGYINDEVRAVTAFAVIASSCFIAAIADLKVYYIELVLLLILAVCLNRLKIKGIVVVLVFPLVIALAIGYFYSISPEGKDFFTVDSIMGYAGEGGYSNETNLNRFTAVQTLQSLFFPSMPDALFGMGLGAGQFSQFFESDTYALWGLALRWNWFTDAAIFLEMGWMGLISYALIFISMMARAFRARKEVCPEQAWVCRSVAAFGFFCLVMFVYNCVLTVEPGCYLAAFILSIPYVLSKKEVYGDD